jgi:hypothetical protein
MAPNDLNPLKVMISYRGTLLGSDLALPSCRFQSDVGIMGIAPIIGPPRPS